LKASVMELRLKAQTADADMLFLEERRRRPQSESSNSVRKRIINKVYKEIKIKYTMTEKCLF